mgnify:CR=1 FL=1
MRVGGNQYKAGQLVNGYDYELQAWVKNGRIQDCGHPYKTAHCFPGGHDCRAHIYAGQAVDKVRADLGL